MKQAFFATLKEAKLNCKSYYEGNQLRGCTCGTCATTPVMNKTTWVSKCCNAETKVVGGDEGTNHWECSKCGESCDATIGATTHGGTWGERLEHWIKTQYGTAGDTQKLESFIASELQQQRREWIEMIEGMKKPLVDYPNGQPKDDWMYGRDRGYNQALDDIIKKVGKHD